MKLPVHASRLFLLAIRLLRLDQLPFVFLDIIEQLTDYFCLSLYVNRSITSIKSSECSRIPISYF